MDMSEFAVTKDTAFRVFKIRLWCDGDEFLCGFQFVYRHEFTMEIITEPLVGRTTAHNGGGGGHVVLRELTLIHGEYVNSATVFKMLSSNQRDVAANWYLMSLATNLNRQLRFNWNGEFVGSPWRHGHELRSLEVVLNQESEIVQVAVVALPEPNHEKLPEATQRRLLELQKSTLFDEFKLLTLSDKVREHWDYLLARFFYVHDRIMATETRGLVSTARIQVQFTAALAALLSYVRKWHIWNGNNLKKLDDAGASIQTLEKALEDVLAHERSSGFELAVQRKDKAAIVSIVQTLMLEDNFDLAAKFCKRSDTFDYLMRQIKGILWKVIPNVDPAYKREVHALHAETRRELVANMPIPRNGYTALHAAVDKRYFHVVELLLLQVGMDPLIRTVQEGKRAIDLAGDIDENKLSRQDDAHRILFLLAQCTKKREFEESTTTLLEYGKASVSELRELVPNMTLVQDLQVIFSLGVQSLPPTAFRRLLEMAFQHVITDKLVFDDEAAVFFRIALEQCFAKEYITKTQLVHWEIKTNQVNMESAGWVTEMKQTIQRMQSQLSTIQSNVNILHTHFNELREALILKIEQEERAARCQQIVSLVSLGLLFVAGPVIKEIMHGVMDLADPMALLSTALELNGMEEIAEFCLNERSDVKFRDGIVDVLRKAEIEPLEFVSVVKEAVILEHPEYASRQGSFLLRDGEREGGTSAPLPYELFFRVEDRKLSRSDLGSREDNDTALELLADSVDQQIGISDKSDQRRQAKERVEDNGMTPSARHAKAKYTSTLSTSQSLSPESPPPSSRVASFEPEPSPSRDNFVSWPKRVSRHDSFIPVQPKAAPSSPPSSSVAVELPKSSLLGSSFISTSSESPPESNSSSIASDLDPARLPRSNFPPSTSAVYAPSLALRGASYGGSYAGSNYSGSYAGSDGQRPNEVVYWVEESDVAASPYHYAVQQSHGDIVDFKECLEIVEEEAGHDINDLFEIVVVEGGERKQLQLPPYVYASYLGYVDIVNDLLSRPDLKLTEGKFVTKNRARKAAKWSPALS